MSWFTRTRDKVTGTVRGAVNTGLGIASIAGALPGLSGLTGLVGALTGSGPLPMPGGQGGQMQGADMGYQQNLQGLANMIGSQVPQTGVSASTTASNDGGLI